MDSSLAHFESPGTQPKNGENLPCAFHFSHQLSHHPGPDLFHHLRNFTSKKVDALRIMGSQNCWFVDPKTKFPHLTVQSLAEAVLPCR